MKPAHSTGHRVKDVFDEAAERPRGERGAFLDSACAGDADLRRRVERLLAAHDDAPDFLEEPPGTDDLFEPSAGGDDGDGGDGDGAEDLAGERIGHYHLRQRIAAGGMGTVYQADQEKPQRAVAVKIMRRGLASRSALRRFEYESQILSRLRHPGIAQVYEAGVWERDGGVPYFVMEYVPGARPITEYARDSSLTTARRLALFASVCGAVHHGHQRGIIHRDLKPANILIDASGQVKIIDFGVALATDSDMVATSLQTDLGHLVGTLQYMSPEQCRADPHELDTRSDVYALGVVLYELLCEELPYDVTHAPVAEAVRVVREQTPARPSSVNRTVRGDVETIVLKAMEKDPERRYASASDLAADITRYLGNEPIVARPPSATYQLRKFAQRHKGLATGAAVVLAVLAGASIVSTSLYVQAERARAETATEREEARRQAAIAEAVNEFLNDDLLASVRPDEQGREVTMREVLDVASASLEGKFPDEPLVEAAIHHTLGEAYEALGVYEPAERHLREARRLRRERLGEEHPGTLWSMHNLAAVYWRQGRYDEAEALYLQTLEIERRVLGEEHPNTLVSMDNLALVYRGQGRYDDAESLHLQTLENRRRVLGEQHPDTLASMLNLAIVYSSQGRYDEAEALHLETLETRTRVLGKEHPCTLESMHNLAGVYSRQGRYDEAEALYLQTLEIEARVLGEEHSDTLGSMYNLAGVYSSQGRYDEAEALYLQTLEIRARVLGKEHPCTLESMSDLATVYLHQGRYDEAEALHLQSLEIKTRVLGEEHPDTLGSICGLAHVYSAQGRYDEAEPLHLQTMEIRTRVRGSEHPDTLHSMGSLAGVYLQQGRYDEAEPLFQQSLEIRRRIQGEEHPDTLWSMEGLAILYDRQGRYDEAEPLHVQALEIERRVLGEEHPSTLMSMHNLAIRHLSQGRYDEAEPVFLQTLEIQRRMLGEEHSSTLRSMSGLAGVYESQGRDDEAESLLLETLEIQRRVLGEKHPDTIMAMNNLAWLLLTAEPDSSRDPQRALELSLKANDLTGHALPFQLDTLSLAYHLTGDTARAIENQRRAIALLPPGESPLRTSMEAALAEFEAAMD